MTSLVFARPRPGGLVSGAIVGAAIAAIDSFGSGGEVSPIIIVALLFFAAALIGALVRVGAFLSTLAIWCWLPGFHLARHLLRLPDTLHPNTYRSIVYLGLFSLAVSVAGMLAGTLVARGARTIDNSSRP